MAARERGVPVFTPEKIGTPEWLERIAALRPDLILSVYYRNMIGTKILALAPLGAFNLHGSLLPKYRGRAPINWAVLHGEPRIGMSLHRMVKAPDAGAVVDQEGVDIGPKDTAEQAFRKVLPCARRILAAADRPAARRNGEGDGAGRGAGHVFRRTQARGRTDRLDADEPADLQPGPRCHRSLSGRLHRRRSARLMVWWADPDSPASRGRRGAPGEVLSLAPLLVATGDGALELTRTDWRTAPAAGAELKIGQRL